MLNQAELKELEQRILNSSIDIADLSSVTVTAQCDGFVVEIQPEDGPLESYRFTYSAPLGDRKMVVMDLKLNPKGWAMELIPGLLFAAMHCAP